MNRPKLAFGALRENREQPISLKDRNTQCDFFCVFSQGCSFGIILPATSATIQRCSSYLDVFRIESRIISVKCTRAKNTILTGVCRPKTNEKQVAQYERIFDPDQCLFCIRQRHQSIAVSTSVYRAIPQKSSCSDCLIEMLSPVSEISVTQNSSLKNPHSEIE